MRSADGGQRARHVLMAESVGPRLGAGVERPSLMMVERVVWGRRSGEVTGAIVRPGSAARGVGGLGWRDWATGGFVRPGWWV